MKLNEFFLMLKGGAGSGNFGHGGRPGKRGVQLHLEVEEKAVKMYLKGNL